MSNQKLNIDFHSCYISVLHSTKKNSVTEVAYFFNDMLPHKTSGLLIVWH